MKKLWRLPRIAFDSEVLKFAAPAYTLPLAIRALSELGVHTIGGPWFWLFGPAIGLHALMTASIASKRAADAPALDTPQAPPQLSQTEAELNRGFSAIHSTDGLKALQDLVYEYTQLQPILARRKITDSMSVAQIPVLASETYRQGMSVLQDAMDLMQATSADDKARLQGEIGDLEKELTSLKSDPSQATRAKIREEQLASDKDLLVLMNKQRDRVDELLYQADRCSASLHRTRMELAALRAEASDDGVSAVLDTLRLTISNAKGVQDEMRKLTSSSTAFSGGQASATADEAKKDPPASPA